MDGRPRQRVVARRGEDAQCAAFLPRMSLIVSLKNLLHPLAAALIVAATCSAAAQTPPDFQSVFRLLDERCLECHQADDYEGGLILESHASLMKGGESGASVIPGKSAESPLIQYVRGEVVKDGKKRIMPPGKRTKLSAEEIALLAAWIDAGALPPSGGPEKPRVLTVQKVTPKNAPRLAINALAFAPASKLLAVGRYGFVELLAADSRRVVRKLESHAGNINALIFSSDGTQLFAASGENGLFGEIRVWNVADGKLVRTIQGHRDTIYALALSPDGQTLASGSYDAQIKLWSAADGRELKTMRGHNGAVFALAFRPDGKVLASASADRTLKLWDAASGARRDTLSQPTKEQHALAWSPDGARLAAAGADNRVRVYAVSADARETTNELTVARFAHEGAIVRLAISGDGKTLITGAQDGTLKLWETAEMKERAQLEKQPDWPSALAFLAGDTTFAVGRLDGTLAFYHTADGKPVPAPPPVPSKLASLVPRGLQRGGASPASFILRGTNLAGLQSIVASDPRIKVTLSEGASPQEAQLAISAANEVPRGVFEISAVGADGKPAGSVKLFVDDLPQLQVDAVERVVTAAKDLVPLPASVWSTLQKPGDSTRFLFDAQQGETLVFALAGKTLGSKINALITLQDASGRVLATAKTDEALDPFLTFPFAAAGRYAVTVHDEQFAGSAEHFFRLSIGALPLATGIFPLVIQSGGERDVELLGANLPPPQVVRVQANAAGELVVPLDSDRIRSTRGFPVLVRDLPQILEAEPNDLPAQATPMNVPGSAAGRFVKSSTGGTSAAASDRDLFRFTARAGSGWVIETLAAQRGSPADTRLEILDAAGQPVPRVLLQAVRDSAITFRPIDSSTADVRVDNWREMKLNEFLFMSGEVAKIFRMPEGPDSGFQFYQGAGKRLTYFDTSATAHSLDEPAYVVEPHPPGTALVSNGLPAFPLYYGNDDDADRRLGTDSRLLFTAPADGTYLVRVSDSRGQGSALHVYHLTVREAQPEFVVRIEGLNLAISPGSGQAFTVAADRQDGFNGEITVEIAGVPAGYMVSSPLTIQAGHLSARGTLWAAADAREHDAAIWAGVEITASGAPAGKQVVHEVKNFGTITLAKTPPLFVALEPVAPGDTLEKLSPPTPLQVQDPSRPFEITIAPGEIIPAWVKIRRENGRGRPSFGCRKPPAWRDRR